MTEIADRLVSFGIGCVVGGVGGYIVAYLRFIKTEVHDLHEGIAPRRNERGILQHRLAFNITFSLMMIFVFYAAFSSFKNSQDLEENYKQDFIRICVAGKEIRDVQRKTVDAVYSLAISVVENDKDRPPKLTEKQKEEINLYIKRANAFRSSAYRDIQPTRDCEPFVDDEDVKPPTAPFPRLK